MSAPVAETDERRAKLRKITEAAAQLLKDEVAEKGAKAHATNLQLAQEAAHLFGPDVVCRELHLYFLEDRARRHDDVRPW